MPICARSRRCHARAVLFASSLCLAAPAIAATDNDPANDAMPGAEMLFPEIGQRLTTSAELVASPDHLDVDFFMIDALAGDVVTVTLARIQPDSNGPANDAQLNLRLHAYTPSADLVSAPTDGQRPAMTFSPTEGGPIFIGVGLLCDSDLDGFDNGDPGHRAAGFGRVETFSGAYDIEITVERQAPVIPDILMEDLSDCDAEVNAWCPPTQTLFPHDGICLIGSLEKRDYPDCQPDTYLVLFNKLNAIINADDNSSTLGNGWASGLFNINGSNGFIDNGDGSRSLRIGVTGRPDGLDGVFNGFFQNAPHEQFGEFTLIVQFYNGSAQVIATETYTDRFKTGAEAFHINFTVPAAAVLANINIDNTTGAIPALPDQDVFHLEGLTPFCDYYITQVGGLNCECEPTDTVMAWVDKSCWIIWDSNEYSPATGYEELLIIADYLGRANFVIAGEDQRSRLLWSGLDLGAADSRDVPDCILPPTDIDYGCYTLCFRLAPPHADSSGPMTSDHVVGEHDAAMLSAMQHGDINMDGVTDTADLGILIGNFGWSN
ncbi:MAG: hypothetical protein H6813_04400 [Phycisphaeraceae bacterium]|nr:hypothetical protein [Phycisphaeraceae bacterium]MCB9847189.1 hypothetical protein [Phycisphaeraceae bacterium]